MRKGTELPYLPHLLAVSAMVLVSAADKLHNARAVLADFRRPGDRLWSRLNARAGWAGTCWFYRRLADGLATRLVADLGIDRAPHVHAEMARHLLSLGRDSLDRAVAHALQVTSADDTEIIITLCDHSGDVNLSLGDYRSARRLFEAASELDLGSNDKRQARRLLSLASAIDGEGDVLGARKLLKRASAIGERLGDVDLVVEATVRHTLPTEWYAGNT